MNILIVDDNSDTLNLLKFYLKEYTVHTADRCVAALEMVKVFDYDLLIIDVKLPDFTGTYLAERVKENKDVPIIFLTNYDTDITKELASEMHTKHYMKSEVLGDKNKLINIVAEHLTR